MAADAVNEVAEGLGDLSRAELARHWRTGASQVIVERGRIDSEVALLDAAADSIEFGTARFTGLHILSRHL